MRAVAILMACVLLAGCAGGPPPVRYSERFERQVRNVANPSAVVATEIAFARAALEDGQWTAFEDFMAPDGVIHGRNGPIDAGPWLAAQDDPPAPVQWTPLAVWSSCDGQMAVSQGKFAEPGGEWGYYVTVWERQRNDTYRWTYDMGAPDAALTERENSNRNEPVDDDQAIVVTAIRMVQGEVADCPSGAQAPLPSEATQGADRSGRTLSRDGSLGVEWVHRADGRRELVAHQWRGGEWEEALRFGVTADGRFDRQ